MKKYAITLVVFFAAVNSGRAVTMESLSSSASDGLFTSGLIQAGGDTKADIPNPGQAQPIITSDSSEGSGYTKMFGFESSAFTLTSDAPRAMEEAAISLQRTGYTVLEKRSEFTKFTIFFQAPSDMQLKKHISGTFASDSAARKAAEECKSVLEALKMPVLEKRVSNASFNITYLATKSLASMEPQTFNRNSFSFDGDAARSMEETATVLRSVNAVILEKRQRGNEYNIVFLAPFKLVTEKYVSPVYSFPSDAKKAIAATEADLASKGMVVLEKKVDFNKFTVTYFNPK